MKYTVKPSGKFKKDLRQAEKRGCGIAEITEEVEMLANGETLPPEYKDHPLKKSVSHITRLAFGLRDLQKRLDFISCKNRLVQRLVLIKGTA